MDAVECDVCGGEHQTEECPELGLVVQEADLGIANTRARLTLPPSLVLADIYGESEGMGVVSQQPIPQKTQFGPFEAKRTTHTFADETLFTLKIVGKNGTGITLDTSDENECNWLCLVRTANSVEEQNCMAYQLGTNIYYNTTQDIQLLEELKVWYAPQYARKMGKPIHPDGVTQVMLGRQVLVVQTNAVSGKQSEEQAPQGNYHGMGDITAAAMEISGMTTTLPNTVHHDGNVSWHSDDKDSQADSQMEQITDSEDVSSAKGEQEKTTGGEFKCPRCGSEFDTEISMAKHLRTHLIPWMKDEIGRENRTGNSPRTIKKSGNYQCPDCNYCARIQSLYRKHRVKVHQVDESSEEENNESDNDDKDSVEMEVTKIKLETEEYKPPSNLLEGVGSSPRRVQPRRSLKGVRTGMEDFVTNIKTKIKEETADSPSKSSIKDKDKNNKNTQQLASNTVVVKRGRGRPRKVVNVDAVLVPEKDNNVVCASNKKEKLKNTKPDIKNNKTVEKITRQKSKTRVDSENQPPSPERQPSNDDVYADGSLDKSSNSITNNESEKPIEVPSENLNIENSESLETVQPEMMEITTTSNLSNEELLDMVENRESSTDKSEVLFKEPSIEPVTMEETTTEMALIDNDEQSTVNEHGTVGPNDEVEQILEESNDIQENDTATKRKIDSSEEEPSSKKMKSDDDTIKVVSDRSEKDEDNVEDDEKDGNNEQPKVVTRGRGRRAVQHKFIQKCPGGYSCTVCGKKFKGLLNIQQHIPAHSNQHRCKACGKRFTRRETLSKHTCEKQKPVDAQNENITSTDDNEGLDKNENEKETEGEGEDAEVQGGKRRRKRRMMVGGEWTCEICQEKFTRKHLLMDHACGEGTSGSGKFSCQICKQSFRTLKYLYRHMAMHTDIFRCAECNKCFSRKDSMQRHVLKCCPQRAEEYKIFFCKICTKAFATKIGLENHTLKCTEYRCQKCSKIFVSEDDFTKHKCKEIVSADESTEKKPTFACSECNKTFQSLNYLRRHKLTHKGNFQCKTCDKTFTRSEELNFHVRLCIALSTIKENGCVQCDQCHMSISSTKEYREHYLEHTHPFKCDKCEKRFIKIGTLHTHSCTENMNLTCDVCCKGGFRNERYLHRHMITHGPAEYECEYCHKSFFRRDYLNDHSCKLPDGTVVRLIRKNDTVTLQERLICHTCGKSFVSVSNLNKHMRIHGEKECTCPICNKSFHYEGYLREHVASVHENKYRYQCSECGKMLKSKTGLITHTKQFHSSNTEFYPCPKCGRIFTQKGNMKVHLYSHATDRKFICPFCHKTFKYPDQLNRHKLIHTMENKLECEYCEKSFCKPYELRKHIMVFHSGLVYICDVCQARCGHRHTVIRHYRRKHPGHVHLLNHSAYVDSLLKQMTTSVKTEPDEGQEGETCISEVIEAGAEVTEVTGIETLQLPVSIEDTLPQMAAEALHSLSHTIIDGTTYVTTDGTTVVSEDGTAVNLSSEEAALALQSIGHTVEGEDGQTVVILQIVNPEEEQIAEEIQLQAI
ncbi:hypothetical protein ScPMuIL_007719 [Solemya velum]